MDWQSLETAPIGEPVLVWSDVYDAPVVAKCGTDRLFWEGDWEYEVRATHWIRLPERPQT